MFASSASGSAVAEFDKCPALGLNIRNFSRAWLLKAEFQSLVSLLFMVSLLLYLGQRMHLRAHISMWKTNQDISQYLKD